VDRLDLIADVFDRAADEHGVACHLHADAAWGGYAVAVTRGAGGERRSYQATLADFAPELWPEEEVFRALSAVERTDSVTIDPHKLGFTPYPAGAVCFADGRVRELVSVEAPYLFHREGAASGYLGRFIFEGSKPGAAAAGVWMSHQVLPLNARGYGRLVGQTAQGALALHRRLDGGDWGEFSVVPLPRPDLNVVCFAIGHPRLASLEATNAFVTRLYEAMSIGGGRGARQLDYFVTKTVLRAQEYGRSALPTVEALGFSEADYRRAGGLAVLRCTVMDPFLARPQGGVDFIDGFATTLAEVMRDELAAA
jgi:glutamate/tyrosine decarboxylase-like PLP-dependent enzyme